MRQALVLRQSADESNDWDTDVQPELHSYEVLILNVKVIRFRFRRPEMKKIHAIGTSGTQDPDFLVWDQTERNRPSTQTRADGQSLVCGGER
jgi:hypothetical protein